MKNKYLIYIIFAFGLLVFTGCKKWLDVESKTQIVESDQLSNEEGYMDAMAGVYYTMGSQALYGKHLTMGLMDVIAQRYDLEWSGTSEFPYPASDQGYFTNTNIRPKIDNIWDSMYYAIANANNIISHIDADRALFTANNYALIKGEALGLRAFLHFDMLRMFGPSYLAAADSLSVPYVTQFTGKVITPLFTVKAITDSVITDLKAAAELLKNDDYNSASVNNPWLNNRKCHFNKWAVDATLARVYLYRADKVNALLHANNVINSTRFRFVTPAEIAPAASNVDYSLTPEQVFSLSKYDIEPTVIQYFTGTSQDKLTNKVADWSGTDGYLSSIYELSAGGATDIRWINQWLYINDVKFSTKFWQSGAKEQHLVPLIRLPEMYYIAAECGGAGAGLARLNEARKQRGLAQLPAGMDDASFQNEIFKEYQKEFYCEGILFYYYKRLNKAQMLTNDNVSTFDNPTYVFPIPEAEKKFLGR